jgi:hypothetical protein
VPRIDALQDLLFSSKGKCGRPGNSGPVWHIRYGGVSRYLRAWADQAHLASKNVDELRQFVDSKPAQDTTKGRNSLIATFGEAWSSIILMPFGHAPELVDMEESASTSDAPLGEEHMTLRTQSHTGADQKHRQRKCA